MRYMMLIHHDEAALAAAPQKELWADFGAFNEALTKAGLAGGERLQPSSAATTVRLDGAQAEVLDGPEAIASGRAPKMGFPIGTYVGAPIVLPDGEVYGTLCCFSFGENPGVTKQDAKTLRYTAQLTAQKIGEARRRKAALELVPVAQNPIREP